MIDIVSSEVRSKMMSGIKGKNTKPELLIRTLLHGAGYRFRLHRKDLPGRPDLVLKRFNAVIFVNGCFWHGHEDCHLFRPPKSRQDFWNKKISENQLRDARAHVELMDLDWRVGIVWECAVKGKSRLELPSLRNKIDSFIHGHMMFLELRGKKI